jgi:hypothetical protein
MLLALSWLLIFSLLALWSLAAWLLNAATAWAVSNAGALAGAAAGAVSADAGLHLPAWLAVWVPPDLVAAVSSLLPGLASGVDNLLQAAPALAGGLDIATWVIWFLGSLLLLLLGAGLHWLAALSTRRGSARS